MRLQNCRVRLLACVDTEARWLREEKEAIERGIEAAVNLADGEGEISDRMVTVPLADGFGSASGGLPGHMKRHLALLEHAVVSIVGEQSA